jgi:hypothetical protein
MFKKSALTVIGLLLMLSTVNAQDQPPTRLRVMQLSFVSNGSATVDIQFDGSTVFEGISFPFATDYVELAPGDHTIDTIVEDNAAEASTTVTLEAGRDYTLIAEGDYTEIVTFTLIDESDLPLTQTGSAAIVVNLTSQPITDIRVDSQPAFESIAPGQYGMFALPVTPFTLGGIISGAPYSEDYTPLANAFILTVVREQPSGQPQVIYHRSSPLTASEYLRAVNDGAQWSQAASLIQAAGLVDALADDGQYTLFLPTNTALEPLFSSLPADAAALGNLLSQHVSARNLPPYVLPNSPALEMLSGSSTSLNFGPTSSGYWEIEGAPILWDLRLANGVIYAIDGILMP